jgi:membrane protease YdiL (CAAX protease family)
LKKNRVWNMPAVLVMFSIGIFLLQYLYLQAVSWLTDSTEFIQTSVQWLTPYTRLSIIMSTIGLSVAAMNHGVFGFRAPKIDRPDAIKIGLFTLIAVMTVAVYGMIAGSGILHGQSIIVWTLGPINEEILFRGLILSVFIFAFEEKAGLKNGKHVAAIVTSVLFALNHIFNLSYMPIQQVAAQIMFAFVVGIAFSWMRIKTDSIFTPIITHSVINFMAWII